MYLFLTRPLQFDTPWTLKVELVAGHCQCDRASLLSLGLNRGPPGHGGGSGCRLPVGQACGEKEKETQRYFLLKQFGEQQFFDAKCLNIQMYFE